MNLEQAREKLSCVLTSAKEKFNSEEFITTTELYFCDKNLVKSPQFKKDSIMIFALLTVGHKELEEDEYCSYGICCEIKTANVDEGEIDKEIANFNAETDAFYEELKSSPSAKDKILEINQRQEKEAEKSMEEFNSEMRKMKLKLYGALGFLAIVAAFLLFFRFIF